MLNYNILSVEPLLPNTVKQQIAANVKSRRLDNNLTQEGLAKRAGLKLPTYRHFERTGDISLKGLLQIAFALNVLEEFQQLFSQRQYQSIQDVINQVEIKRKRGKKL